MIAGCRGTTGPRSRRCSKRPHDTAAVGRRWPHTLENLAATTPRKVLQPCRKDTSEAITKLQRTLREWEQKTGETLLVLLCPDIRQDKDTQEQRLHFDLIGCTSVSLDKARDVIKGGWSGSYCSVTAMRTPEKAIRYFAKYQKPKRGDFRCLLARRNGLNNLYGMATLCKRFGTSAEELWVEQRREWFGDEEMEKPTYQKALQHPRVIPKVSEMIRSIVLGDPTRRELAARSGLRPDLFRHIVSKLRQEAGLRQDFTDGECYPWFDYKVLGVEQPENPESVGRFVFKARRAIGAVESTKSSYCLLEAANNNRKILSPSPYTEPVDLPEILRRSVSRE